MPEQELKFGDAVVYNGGENRAHRLAFVTEVNDGNLINLTYVNDDGQWSPVQEDVPRRSPDDYEAADPPGGGHTWFYRD